jgi:hypothetical protein
MDGYRRFCERYGLDPCSDNAGAEYVEARRNLAALYSAAARAGAIEAIESAPVAESNRQWFRDRIKTLAAELYSQSGKSTADHQTYALLRQAAGLQEDQIQKEATHGAVS